MFSTRFFKFYKNIRLISLFLAFIFQPTMISAQSNQNVAIEQMMKEFVDGLNKIIDKYAVYITDPDHIKLQKFNSIKAEMLKYVGASTKFNFAVTAKQVTDGIKTGANVVGGVLKGLASTAGIFITK